MSARDPQSRAPPGIVVSLANTANARLLEKVLADRYRLDHGLAKEDEDRDTAAIELVVVDLASLRRERERIGRMRERASPMILPVLLVADGRSGAPDGLTSELGRTVDDILRIPTTRAELTARIENLLRLRALSRDQEEARQQLARMVSALHTLNACDSIVVRSRTEGELVEALCRTIIEEEGYSLAWIGFATDKARPVTIRGRAGPAADFVEELHTGWLDEPQGPSPVAETMRTGRAQIIRDIAGQPASPMRDRALARGLAALVTLPLNIERGPSGCLAIYSDTPGHFGHEERQLLERLADNLTFGLNALRTRREGERQAAEIQSLAYTDALTGLPNRRHLVDYLDGRLADFDRKEVYGAVLFIDLDGFKLVNDALGHEVGDEVLKEIARRLQATVRETDLVVRQGGDEFLVVMFNDPRRGESNASETVVGHAQMLAGRIIKHLSEPLMAGGYEHRLTTTVGIALCPEHGRDAATLIENADKAMYEAKKAGGGRSHVFSKEIATRRQHRLSMESRLYRALEQNEFELHYQPIFELDSCRVVATEALIRLPQEDQTYLMPGDFIPLVEEIGLINPLGKWVLATAAQQLAAWHRQGISLTMTVNVSLNQLSPDGDAVRLADIVRTYVDPSWIHLEVTENALMADPPAIEGLLSELHAQGFRLAIDDFGTGYSSLSRLQYLPIHTLKIDRSFVAELDRPGGKGTTLIPIIQQMAQSLGLQTIAEGIETEEQRSRLLEYGTKVGQGFWFSPAVPSRDLEQLLDTWNRK